MPEIELDEITFEMLQNQANQVDGGNLCECIRRLLSDAENGRRSGQRQRKRMPRQVVVPEKLTPDDLAGYRSAIHRMLCLMGWLASEKGMSFERIEEISGRKRRYFARSKAEIEGSGKSVAPKQIPGTEYWMATNLSNEVKAAILKRVLEVFDFPATERREWIKAVLGDGEQVTEIIPWINPPEEDDDPYKI